MQNRQDQIKDQKPSVLLVKIAKVGNDLGEIVKESLNGFHMLLYTGAVAGGVFDGSGYRRIIRFHGESFTVHLEIFA